MIFKVFHGEYKGDYDYNKVHESGIVMLTPLILLSIGAIFAGYFFNNLLFWLWVKGFLNGIIYLANEKHSYSSIFTILSKSFVAIGVVWLFTIMDLF